jgi:hypothetical protein
MNRFYSISWASVILLGNLKAARSMRRSKIFP